METSATDMTDGISVKLSDWRFNLRSSNTESVLRLNCRVAGKCLAYANNNARDIATITAVTRTSRNHVLSIKFQTH